MLLLLLLIPSMLAEESATPSSLLEPRTYNHHPYETKRYRNFIEEAEPTKEGPVLFPNDAPPPPRPPLIVTSRPLVESIARSDLNPVPQDINNTIPSQSQINRVTYKPDYLDVFKHLVSPSAYGVTPSPLGPTSNPYEVTPNPYRVTTNPYKDTSNLYRVTPNPYRVTSDPYRVSSNPYVTFNPYESTAVTPLPYGVTPNTYLVTQNSYEASSKPNNVKPIFLAKLKNYKVFDYPLLKKDPSDYDPYANVVHKTKLNSVKDNGYSDFKAQTALPPIYKVLADQATQKVLKIKQAKLQRDHHHDHHHQKNKPEYSQSFTNDGHDTPDNYDDTDNNEGSNYAFSYTVRDHKTGDDFSHSQQSSGSATNGEYRVRLPDGRMQIVSYTADENGYKADVRYDDEHNRNAIENHIDEHTNRNDHFHDKVHNQNQVDYNQNKHEYVDNENVYKVNSVPQHINHDALRGYYGYDYINSNDYGYNDDNIQNRDFKPLLKEENVNYKDNIQPIKEDFSQYSDLSTEYNNDYSAEYDGKHDHYDPHRSKFTFAKNEPLGVIVVPKFKPRNKPAASSVKPSYNDIKHLFEQKHFGQNQQNPVEINVPSTTPSNFEQTSEHVVLIGNRKNVYTNIKNVPVTSIPTFSTDSVTPKSYLVSTIANLKSGEKPVLSKSFIDRINKYISFN